MKNYSPQKQLFLRALKTKFSAIYLPKVSP